MYCIKYYVLVNHNTGCIIIKIYKIGFVYIVRYKLFVHGESE